LIKSSNVVFIYNKNGGKSSNKHILGRFSYEAFRDFRGNVIVESWNGVINKKSVNLQTYVYGHGEYGIGRYSYTVINGKVVSDGRYKGKKGGLFFT